MNSNHELDRLLGLAIADLDIPDAIYRRAIDRYESLARWMADWSPHRKGRIYTQGSARLGTMVGPIDPDDDYDFDLVYERDVERGAITKRELKSDAGNCLRAYVTTSPEGSPLLEEGKRCWTLDYPGEPFHMDTLPSVPNEEDGENAIWLTDKSMFEWQPSNPIAYADWFDLRMRSDVLELSEALRKRGMEIEDAPLSARKTNLQRTSQALKRHRDMYFAGMAAPGPASVVITTLAALAYQPGGSLFETIAAVTSGMAEGLEFRDGVWWLENPVLPTENFAHRWEDDQDRADQFFSWLEQAQKDFSGYGKLVGESRLLEAVARTLGPGPARQVGRRLGERLNTARTLSTLGVTSAGLLVDNARRPAPSHTFHGDQG